MSRSRRGVLAIASGAAGGQIIGLIVTPIISRIYGPEVYGDFALIQSVASVLMPVATLRLPFALLRSKDDRSVKTLLLLGLLLSGFIAMLGSAAVYLGSLYLGIESVAATGSGFFWIFLMAWATAVFSYLSQVALRVHEYKAVGIRHVTQQSTSGVSQVLMGLVSSAGHTGLSAGRVLGLITSCIPLVKPSLSFWRSSGWSKPSALVREYWQYPLLFTPSALLNVLGTQLPILLASTAYASDIVGQLGMAQRIALIPSALIGMAVSQVFASEIAAKLRAGGSGVRREFLSISSKLGVLAIVVGLVLFLLGPWAIPFFLGHEWTLAGEFAQAMAVSIALGIVASPLSSVLLVTKAAVASLSVDSVRVVLLLSAYSVAMHQQMGPVEMIWLLYAVLATTYLISYFVSYSVVRNRERES